MFNQQELVSDYAAGRLDSGTAQELEIAAAFDPRLAEAIAAACELNRRVRSRWATPANHRIVALSRMTA